MLLPFPTVPGMKNEALLPLLGRFRPIRAFRPFAPGAPCWSAPRTGAGVVRWALPP